MAVVHLKGNHGHEAAADFSVGVVGVLVKPGSKRLHKQSFIRRVGRLCGAGVALHLKLHQRCRRSVRGHHGVVEGHLQLLWRGGEKKKKKKDNSNNKSVSHDASG